MSSGAAPEPIRTNCLQVWLCLPLLIHSFSCESVFETIEAGVVQNHFRQEPWTEEVNKALSLKASAQIASCSWAWKVFLLHRSEFWGTLRCKESPVVYTACHIYLKHFFKNNISNTPILSIVSIFYYSNLLSVQILTVQKHISVCTKNEMKIQILHHCIVVFLTLCWFVFHFWMLLEVLKLARRWGVDTEPEIRGFCSQLQ